MISEKLAMYIISLRSLSTVYLRHGYYFLQQGETEGVKEELGLFLMKIIVKW